MKKALCFIALCLVLVLSTFVVADTNNYQTENYYEQVSPSYDRPPLVEPDECT